MTEIQLHTFIQASPERCFDLSRDVGLHLQSTVQTGERVVAGRESGLLESGDTITWEAVHLGFKQMLSTQITGFDRPVFFENTILKGAFKSMRHEHHFRPEENGTIMTDIFRYETPFGVAGKWFDYLYLKGYMTRLLQTRNKVIQAAAES